MYDTPTEFDRLVKKSQKTAEISDELGHPQEKNEIRLTPRFSGSSDRASNIWFPGTLMGCFVKKIIVKEKTTEKQRFIEKREDAKAFLLSNASGGRELRFQLWREP
jgi:hypothetical protein